VCGIDFEMKADENGREKDNEGGFREKERRERGNEVWASGKVDRQELSLQNERVWYWTINVPEY
jgi:hypothetical protein